MNYFYGNIEQQTLENNYFRKVIFTGPNSQLVLMSLNPSEEIGLEVHTVDQFFRIEQGKARFIIDDKEVIVEADHAVIVPANTQHNATNIGTEDLKLYTIYSPANHPEGTIHKTKAEALEAEKHEHH